MGISDKATKAIEHATDKATKKLERQESVLEARRKGQSFREIARQQRRDVSNVHQDFQRAMNRLSPIENLEEYRRLMVIRLEGILEDAMCNLELAEDFKEWHSNVDVTLKTIDRLVKVTGLDKHEPDSGTAVDVTVTFADVEQGLKTLARHGVIDVSEYMPEVEEGKTAHGVLEVEAVTSEHETELTQVDPSTGAATDFQ